MRRGVLIGIGVAVVVVAVGFWYLFIRDDAPPELTLEEAVADVAETTEAPTSEPAAEGATTTSSSAAPASLDGEWAISQENTIVGYRIGEEISGIGTVEAVGRTSEVTGTLTLNGSVLESVAIEVDMTTLQSDSGTRDNQLRTRGLETDTFPTGTFVLTAPVDLGSVPAEGETVSATATGDLTIHGVTQSVEMPIEGTLASGQILVVGSLEVVLADYDIEPPVGFRILTIEDQGVFEVQLAFTR